MKKSTAVLFSSLFYAAMSIMAARHEVPLLAWFMLGAATFFLGCSYIISAIEEA